MLFKLKKKKKQKKTIELLLNYLEQIKREDVIKIINNERGNKKINRY